MGFAALIGAFVLLLTLTGKFGGVETAAWRWYFVVLGPTLGLLFAGVVLNPNPSKVVRKRDFNLLMGGATAYLLLVLATLLGMEQWLNVHTEGGIDAYLSQSLAWILPFEALVLAAAAVFYFRKLPLSMPNETIMLEYAQKKADYARRFGSLTQQKAFDSLLKGQFDALFALLRGSLPLSESDDVVVLQGAYARVQEDLRFQTVDPAEAQRHINRLTLALIDFIEKCP